MNERHQPPNDHPGIELPVLSEEDAETLDVLDVVEPLLADIDPDGADWSDIDELLEALDEAEAVERERASASASAPAPAPAPAAARSPAPAPARVPAPAPARGRLPPPPRRP